MPDTLERQARSLSELEELRPTVEAAIGRELREAERSVDVLALDAALNKAKDDLHAAIEAEKRRAIRRGLRGRKIRLELTEAMLAPLKRLYRLGRREALAELERLGFAAERAYAADPEYERLRPKARFLRAGLLLLSLRIEKERLSVDLSEATYDVLTRALYRVPGGRDLASRLVSGSLDAGLAATFEANAELAGGFEYSAVLDGGTCVHCSARDGELFHSWQAIQAVLPDGGPNPECLGQERCRCRPVPLPL